MGTFIMTNEMIQKMFAEAVKAKVERSNALGTKATWSMSDHLDAAARIIAEAVKDEVDEAVIRDVVQKTYNHSAFAQKLEKAFEKFGHFQRESRGKMPTLDGFLDTLARETAEKPKAGVGADMPTPTAPATPTE